MPWIGPGSVLAQQGVAPKIAAAPSEQRSVVAKAREHFRRGTDYYAEGDYRAALIEFERAYSLQPTHRLFYNLGQLSYELRDYARAERYFRRYLVEGEGEVPAERRAEVERELGKLRERVASVHIETQPPGALIQIDEREMGSTPFSLPLRVSAGQRRLVAELPGRAPLTRVVELVGGEERTLRLTFGPPLVAAGEPDEAPATTSGTNWAPWVAGITTGVLAIGATGVGYSAFQDANAQRMELARYTSRERLDELTTRAETKANVMDVLLGAAIVGAAVTAILILTDSDDEGERPAGARSSSAQPSARAF
jgi:hypothetical protein